MAIIAWHSAIPIRWMESSLRLATAVFEPLFAHVRREAED